MGISAPGSLHAVTGPHTERPLTVKMVTRTSYCLYDVRAGPPRSLGQHMTVPSSIWRHSSRPSTSLMPRRPMPRCDVWQAVRDRKHDVMERFLQELRRYRSSSLCCTETHIQVLLYLMGSKLGHLGAKKM